MDSLALAPQVYSRKDKSLGVLVANFLTLYNRPDVDLFGLDDAAAKLGVERRRIYDVVNILESIGLVARSGKNQYSWKGFGAVPRALSELKEQGMKEKFAIVPFVAKSEMVVYEKEGEESFMLSPDDQEFSPSPRPDNRKERTLWLLAQNFVKLFLCSDDDLVTFDSATKALLNESQDMNMRKKVRRLYDIANVFSSMKLIEKTHVPETKKPAYRWLGSKTIFENRFIDGSASLCDRNVPKKRAFGTELTNVNAKRNKSGCSKEDSKRNGNQNTSIVIKQEHCDDVKPDVKNFASGSSTPAGTSESNDMGNNIRPRGRLGVIEALSTLYQPSYCNPELLGLFAHYNETFRSYQEEFGREK
ncbi:E2F transcription factor-like E2FD [Arabidopsis thaliana]